MANDYGSGTTSVHSLRLSRIAKLEADRRAAERGDRSAGDPARPFTAIINGSLTTNRAAFGDGGPRHDDGGHDGAGEVVGRV